MTATIYLGCCLSILSQLQSASVNSCVTSPPYFGLRDYGVAGQLGLEQSPDEYVSNMVNVFREVRRVLRDDGTLWLNVGDSYAGSGKGRNADGTHQEGGKQGTNKGTIIGKINKTAVPEGLKPKDLLGIPWRLAFALQADGWYLRSDIIWNKPNAMPESVKDRPTKSHEYLFLLSKQEQYYYDHGAVEEAATTGITSGEEGRGKRNRRSVWTIPTKPFKGAHFATFPPDLIEPCIMAGSQKGGVILDPFFGSGTTGLVAHQLGRHSIGIELNPAYKQMAVERLREEMGLFSDIVEA